jgi:hypothetical protein
MDQAYRGKLAPIYEEAACEFAGLEPAWAAMPRQQHYAVSEALIPCSSVRERGEERKLTPELVGALRNGLFRSPVTAVHTVMIHMLGQLATSQNNSLPMSFFLRITSSEF